MTGSPDTLIRIEGQHPLEITRTNIVIDTNFPLCKVNLPFSENARNLLIH